MLLLGFTYIAVCYVTQSQEEDIPSLMYSVIKFLIAFDHLWDYIVERRNHLYFDNEFYYGMEIYVNNDRSSHVRIQSKCMEIIFTALVVQHLDVWTNYSCSNIQEQ